MNKHAAAGILILISALGGCTFKAVGDPERPITIKAHITLDVKGLHKTARSIEDYVQGDADEIELSPKEK